MLINNDIAEDTGTHNNPTSALPPQDGLYIDPEGNLSFMKTDKYSRLLSETDALGNVTTYERDTETGFVYNDNGNLIQIIDHMVQ